MEVEGRGRLNEGDERGLTLIVTSTIVTNVFNTLGQSLDKFLIKDTNSRSRIIVSVDTDYSIVFTTRLAVLEELFSR